jgi:hypothetical protein
LSGDEAASLVVPPEVFGLSCNHRVKLAKLHCLAITSDYPLQKMRKVKKLHSIARYIKL